MLGKLLALPVRIINLPLVAVDKVIDRDVSVPLEDIAESIESVVDKAMNA